MVAGGPPCQPFSFGGKHKADQDSRDLFPFAIQAIEQLAPKAFIFENVKGLLRSSFSDYFEYILLRLTYPCSGHDQNLSWMDHLKHLRAIKSSDFSGLKYNVHYQLMNAADYGVPQCRERVFIVGTRSDLNVSWCFPEPSYSKDRLLWDMHVTGAYWERHHVAGGLFASEDKIKENLKRKYGLFEPEGLPWMSIRDALNGLPDPRACHTISDHLFRDGAKIYPGHTGSVLDWPSKTIKAGGHGVPGGENMIRFEDGTVRYLTVFEAKRIQGFPDDFVITGAWGESMRQIGNAVPVALAKQLGSLLIDKLRKTTQGLAQRGDQVSGSTPINYDVLP